MIMENVEVYNFRRDYALINLNINDNKIELNAASDLAIIDTRYTSKFKMKLIRFILKFNLKEVLKVK